MYNRYTNSIFNFYLPLNCMACYEVFYQAGEMVLIISYPQPQWTLTMYFLPNRKGSAVPLCVVKCCSAIHFSCGCQFTGTVFWE